MTSSSNSNQSMKAAAIVTIIALLGLNIFQFISRNNLVKLNETQETELVEAEKLQTELEKEYYQALSDLEEHKSNNLELNALIDSQKEELKQQKEKISRLITDSKDLRVAKEQLFLLRSKVEQYVTELENLREENTALVQANLNLTESNMELTDSIEEERMFNQELQTEKEHLSDENQKLQEAREKLEYKVDMASIIEVSGINAEGLMRRDDKEVSRNKAEKVDVLRLCFETSANEIAGSGVETFHLRILSPQGTTLAEEQMGSGIMVDRKSGEKMRYTQAKIIEYDAKSSQICTRWAPNAPFMPGNYQVEIYNKGFLAGTGSFRLK